MNDYYTLAFWARNGGGGAPPPGLTSLEAFGGELTLTSLEAALPLIFSLLSTPYVPPPLPTSLKDSDALAALVAAPLRTVFLEEVAALSPEETLPTLRWQRVMSSLVAKAAAGDAERRAAIRAAFVAARDLLDRPASFFSSPLLLRKCFGLGACPNENYVGQPAQTGATKLLPTRAPCVAVPHSERGLPAPLLVAMSSAAVAQHALFPPLAPPEAQAAPPSHAGKWRIVSSEGMYCSLPGYSADGHFCKHEEGLIKVNHWSCCGEKAQSAMCSHVPEGAQGLTVPPPLEDEEEEEEVEGGLLGGGGGSFSGSSEPRAPQMLSFAALREQLCRAQMGRSDLSALAQAVNFLDSALRAAIEGVHTGAPGDASVSPSALAILDLLCGASPTTLRCWAAAEKATP